MKRLLTIIIITIFSASSVFAKSGLELGVFVPFDLSVGINKYSLTNETPTEDEEKKLEAISERNKKTSQAGFDSGVLIHIGYRFDINKDMSFSLLGELGYSHDVFAFKNPSNPNNKELKNTISYNFESMIFGLYPKFNWKKFSFGVGFGLKVPLYASTIYSSYDYENSNIKRRVNSIGAFEMKDIFETPIIPYLKFSVDYSLYSAKKFDVVVGGYIGGDFGMSFKEAQLNNNSDINNKKIVRQSISSFDIGVQIGMKIMPLN